MSHPLRLLAALVCAALLGPAAAAQAGQQLYVSLGDSYASGYQATGVGTGANTREGFAYQVPALAKARGHDLKLVNFGCAGATSGSLIRSKGCAAERLGPGGTAYPGRTQLQAAEAYLRRNRSRVALVTVSIGGNDITACATDPDPISCTALATGKVTQNVASIARRLRRAAGPKARIVGTTYPDVLLAQWLDPASRQLATLSVGAFQGLINPGLQKSYAAGKASFVDVTKATGAYIPFSQTTALAPFGEVPQAVAEVCELTWMCRFRDIHANAAGYRVIATLVAQRLPKR